MLLTKELILRNIKIIYGKLCFPIFLLLIIIGCSNDNNVSPIPNYPPNMFAEISDSYAMSYKGFANMFASTEPFGLIIISQYKNDKGQSCYLGINIFFPDKEYSTGTFQFRNTKHIDSTYAVAFFEIGVGDAKQTFISSSGKLNITEITNLNFKATFDFIAFDNNGKRIIVKNGNIIIN